MSLSAAYDELEGVSPDLCAALVASMADQASSWITSLGGAPPSGDATVCVWDFRGKGPEGTRPTQLRGHQASCSALAFEPTRPVLASGGQDSGVLLWKPRRRALPLRYALLEDEVTAVQLAPRQDPAPDLDAVLGGSDTRRLPDLYQEPRGCSWLTVSTSGS